MLKLSNVERIISFPPLFLFHSMLVQQNVAVPTFFQREKELSILTHFLQ